MTYDPGPKDLTRRTSPFLVLWEQLPEEQRDSDRETVRDLPRLLASVGLQVVRVGPRPGSPLSPRAET